MANSRLLFHSQLYFLISPSNDLQKLWVSFAGSDDTRYLTFISELENAGKTEDEIWDAIQSLDLLPDWKFRESVIRLVWGTLTAKQQTLLLDRKRISEKRKTIPELQKELSWSRPEITRQTEDLPKLFKEAIQNARKNLSLPNEQQALFGTLGQNRWLAEYGVPMLRNRLRDAERTVSEQTALLQSLTDGKYSKEESPFPSTPIEQLKLHQRTQNILRMGNILTLRAICLVDDIAIFVALRGFGRNALNEINALRKANGVTELIWP